MGGGRTRPFPKALFMLLPSTSHLCFSRGALRSQGRWHMPITLTLRRLRKEDGEFKAYR